MSSDCILQLWFLPEDRKRGLASYHKVLSRDDALALARLLSMLDCDGKPIGFPDS